MRYILFIFIFFLSSVFYEAGAFGDHKADADQWLKRQHFIWPMEGKIISTYGQRGRRFHNGLDIKGTKGHEIRSIGAGKVLFAGVQKGYGKVAIIDHGNGVQSLYAHCQSILKNIKPDALVERGQIIGSVGTTGNARGAHLHFEIREELKGAVDPRLFLVPQLAVSTNTHWSESIP